VKYVITLWFKISAIIYPLPDPAVFPPGMIQ